MKVMIDGIEYVPKKQRSEDEIASDLCHKCGGQSVVIDSRMWDGFTRRYRRRRCVVCGTKWTTYEVAVREEEKE